MSVTRPIATVFGGSGFIGRYITYRLAKAGWSVRVAVRRPKTSTEEDETVIKDRSAIRIKRIAAATNQVDKLGIQLHPFCCPL